MKLNIKSALAVLCAGLISSAYATTCYLFADNDDGYDCTKIGYGIGTTTFPPCTTTAGIISDAVGTGGSQMVADAHGIYTLKTTMVPQSCTVESCHAINPCTQMTVYFGPDKCSFTYYIYDWQDTNCVPN